MHPAPTPVRKGYTVQNGGGPPDHRHISHTRCGPRLGMCPLDRVCSARPRGLQRNLQGISRNCSSSLGRGPEGTARSCCDWHPGQSLLGRGRTPGCHWSSCNAPAGMGRRPASAGTSRWRCLPQRFGGGGALVDIRQTRRPRQ